jgi:hypothetical protein
LRSRKAWRAGILSALLSLEWRPSSPGPSRTPQSENPCPRSCARSHKFRCPMPRAPVEGGLHGSREVRAVQRVLFARSRHVLHKCRDRAGMTRRTARTFLFKAAGHLRNTTWLCGWKVLVNDDYVWISRPIHKRGWIVEYYPGKMLHLIGPPVPGRLLLIAPKCVSGG